MCIGGSPRQKTHPSSAVAAAMAAESAAFAVECVGLLVPRVGGPVLHCAVVSLSRGVFATIGICTCCVGRAARRHRAAQAPSPCLGRSRAEAAFCFSRVPHPSRVLCAVQREEDDAMIRLVERYGTRKWSVVGSHIPGRNGKQCRERCVPVSFFFVGFWRHWSTCFPVSLCVCVCVCAC